MQTDSKGAVIPQHIAIILDGNRRWAKERGLPKLEGHREGVQNAGRIINAANNLGVRYMTLYIFSSENWKRSVEEVGVLMSLFESYILSKSEQLLEKNIRVQFVGDLTKISPKLLKIVEQLMKRSEENSGMNLIIALSYGGRGEIVEAAKRIAKEYKAGNCGLEEIDESYFKEFLYAKAPDPDLLIRTGGDIRISNFLLWQLAYTELYFTKTYWPDFTVQSLEEAIAEWSTRERRYGE
jgi:undecaprenyl diphosphate synthase